MADQSESAGTPSKAAGNGGNAGRNPNPNSNRSRNRNRNRNRNRGAGGGGGNANARKKGQGGGGGGGQRPSGQGSGKGGNRSRSGSARGGQPRDAVALAPPPILEPMQMHPGPGALQIYPGEVAANRRRAIVLCAWTAAIPALLFGALLWAAVSPVAGIAALVGAGAAVMYGVWRVAPAVALRKIGAVSIDEHDDPRLYNVTEGLCATLGLSMPSLNVVVDDVPNACALGRDARRSDLVVTTGLVRRMDPIALEGVIAHELAHLKRGDNGVSCVGITLATLIGGETMLRRCVGRNREYRADVVGASAVRYPRGLLDALRIMMDAPPPAEGSFFASPSRFGPTRWVWIDPSVGHREDPPAPGDLDATSVRAAALSEW